MDQGLQELLERDKAVFAEHQAEFVGAVGQDVGSILARVSSCWAAFIRTVFGFQFRL